jgi:AtzE family amidohydrolase
MSIEPIEWKDAARIAQDIRERKLTAAEVAENALARARTIGKDLNCYSEVFEKSARQDAARIDAALKAGSDPGPLAGVPFAIKNLFDVAGVVTLAGSKINRENRPAEKDATAVTLLRRAGAVLVGALGMDEYAYGFTTENTHYGPVRNPHDPLRTAGGSSGGSGAAVAGGCVPIALGSDTNGSVRVPASVCGLFGLKPTYGRVSRAGTYPFTPSLDHVGVLTRSVRDAALVFDLVNGFDPADPVSLHRPREVVSQSLDCGIKALRIVRAGGYFEEAATADALEAWARVADALGATGKQEVPEANTARNAAMIVSAVEGSAIHIKDLRKRPADFDPMTRDRFIAGALFPAEGYVRAQLFRRTYAESIRQLFQSMDILVAPGTPMVAPRIGQEEIEINGSIFPSRPHMGRFTQPISFVGLPVVVVPIKTAGGLPIGVQLIGAPYSEGILLRAARFLEGQGVVAAFRPQV